MSLAPPVALAFIVLLTARQLASITWTVVPSESFDLPASFAPARPVPGTSSRSAPATSALAASHLFGAEEALPARAPEVSAPAAYPGLTLSGTIGDIAGGTTGLAIISSAAHGPRLYRVGDTLDGMPTMTVETIEKDRVTLSRDGTLATLWLSATTTAQSFAPRGGATE